MERKPYPSDVSDDEWAFVAPYLTLMTADAPQRDYRLRAGYHGLRWMVRAGAAWRMMPHDLPPWHTVYQQSQRWLKAGSVLSLEPSFNVLSCNQLEFANGIRTYRNSNRYFATAPSGMPPWAPPRLHLRRPTPQPRQRASGGWPCRLVLGDGQPAQLAPGRA
jgi:hypothetical protein